jgi:hypothetical protein
MQPIVNASDGRPDGGRKAEAFFMTPTGRPSRKDVQFYTRWNADTSGESAQMMNWA